MASQLARLSALRLGLEAAQRALGQGEPPPEDLARLQALLEKETGHPSFEILLRGERAALHEFLEHWGSSGANNLPEFLENDRVRRDHPRMFNLLRRQLEIAGRPPHERRPLQQELDEDIRALPQGTLKKGLTGIDRLEREERLRLAALRCAVAALAAERYRQANRAWPGALADLQGLVPADALVNPHTGKPLDYRRRPDGVSLAAPEDAKGLTDPAQVPPAFPSEGVFRLWGPAHRGRPPTPRPPGPRQG